MSGGSHTFCTACGAQLRRGKASGTRCDPCARKGIDLAALLPAGWFGACPQMRDALAGYDFGTAFRMIRAETGLSQQKLGELIGFEQRRVSEIERGLRNLRDVRLVAQVTTRLGIPPVMLGFGTPATVEHAGAIFGQKDVSWMDRRDFVGHVAAAALGVTASAGLDVDRLLGLLPHDEPAGTRRVGHADVDVIEGATEAYQSQDFATGGALARGAAVSQLRAALPLLNAQMPDEVRQRMHVATGHLALIAGWISFEANDHDAARRLWMVGLDVTRETDDPLGADLAAYTLSDLALQAVHLGRPDEALRIVRIGEATAASPHPVTPQTRLVLSAQQAWAYGSQNNPTECDRALGQVTDHFDHFAAIDPATAPAWVAWLDAAGPAPHYQGRAYYDLARSGGGRHAAELAVPVLRHSVDHFGPSYGRLRAASLSDLAGAHALAGDIDTAVAVGHEAVDAIVAVHSPRTRGQLRSLSEVLEPMNASPGVAELRERLVTA